jgi:ABC-type branched-subunit amino acid transport system ATPase component
MSAPLLEVRGLARDFGGIAAVQGVDFDVQAGQIKALIGPNGAGKTTILNVISGALAPSRGRIVFQGRALPSCRPHAVAARGIARTFQLTRLFGEMTALENVLVGCHRRGRAGWGPCAARTRAMRDEERRLQARARAMLRFVGLEARAGVAGSALPYGEQRLVEVARALAMAPVLLLLDEPGAGLDPEEHRRLGDLLRRIRAQGITVLLVDHHMDLVMDVSDEVLVLCHGEKLAEGAPSVVRGDRGVIEAYLGEDEPC